MQREPASCLPSEVLDAARRRARACTRARRRATAAMPDAAVRHGDGEQDDHHADRRGRHAPSATSPERAEVVGADRQPREPERRAPRRPPRARRRAPSRASGQPATRKTGSASATTPAARERGRAAARNGARGGRASRPSREVAPVPAVDGEDAGGKPDDHAAERRRSPRCRPPSRSARRAPAQSRRSQRGSRPPLRAGTTAARQAPSRGEHSGALPVDEVGEFVTAQVRHC